MIIEALLNIYRNHIVIDKKTSQSLWHPFTMFDNLMKIEETKIVGKVAGAGVMDYSNHSRSVYYIEAIQVKFSCAMRFEKFPFDSHNCYLSYYNPVCKYRTRAIITRSRFETALDYKPRIFKVRKVSLHYKPRCNINRGL